MKTEKPKCRVCGGAAQGEYGWKSTRGVFIRAPLCAGHARHLRQQTKVVVLRNYRRVVAVLTTLACVLALLGCEGPAFTVLAQHSAPDAGEPSDSGGAESGESADAGGNADVNTDHDAGQASETSGDAGPCLTDLSNVGKGDFRIEFTVTTTADTEIALLNQGTVCMGAASAWDVAVYTNGAIAGSTFDGHNVVSLYSSSPVNDGQPHKIVFARTAGKLWTSKDGGPADSQFLADADDLGPMAPLTVGIDACTAMPLAGHGMVSDVCITK